MNPILKNILGVVAGVIVGGLLNSFLIQISSSVIPPPPGTDVTTPEGIIAAMPLLEPKHFIFPFLAHALGTLVGACLAARIAATHKMRIAIALGVFFLLGGIMAAFMIPAPTWFIAVDLGLAYLPMAYLAGKCAVKSN